MPRLQVHLPISPTPSFFLMIRCFAASLRAFGGAFRDARIVVSVGEDCDPYDIASVHPELEPYDITWRWVDRKAFRDFSYDATGLDAWIDPFESDYALICDADILVIGPIDDVVDRLPSEKSVAGVIATWPPFLGRDAGDDYVRWPELFSLAGLPPPEFTYPIPGYKVFYDEDIPFAPSYFNYGFVLGTREAMNSMRDSIFADYRTARSYMQTDLASQASLCLAIARNQVDAVALPVKYNFWTHPKYLPAFPTDAADIRVLHYLTGAFRKHVDNASEAILRQWVAANRVSPDATTALVAHCFSRILATFEHSPVVAA